MADPHAYSISIEHILRDVFICERGGFGGLVDADFIDTNPLAAISAGLAFIYATSEQPKRVEILKFLNDYSWYLDFSVADLLLLSREPRDINGLNYSLGADFETGEEVIERLIEDLRALAAN